MLQKRPHFGQNVYSQCVRGREKDDEDEYDEEEDEKESGGSLINKTTDTTLFFLGGSKEECASFVYLTLENKKAKVVLVCSVFQTKTGDHI